MTAVNIIAAVLLLGFLTWAVTVLGQVVLDAHERGLARANRKPRRPDVITPDDVELAAAEHAAFMRALNNDPRYGRSA